jgi:integrase
MRRQQKIPQSHKPPLSHQPNQPHRSHSPLSTLTYTEPHTIHLRDGEVVLFKRQHSHLWQCRYKLADGTWHRTSTRCASIEAAVAAATNLYDESRYRQRLGLAHRAQSFAHLAHSVVEDLRRQLDAGVGKSVYQSYITCIERYFLPYFQDRQLEEISHTDIVEFEIWRNRQMGRQPKASTLNNFASAWSRLTQTAVNRGWISDAVPVPKLSTRGEKSQPRPAFNRAEIEHLLVYMVEWSTKGRLAVEREMRPLLRDYVEMLLLTGIRHGTEALGISWKHIEWHTDKDIRYLRIWVNGKTGGRWLIAKHRAVDVLKRLHSRQQTHNGIEFEQFLKERTTHKLFTFNNGYQPPSLNGTFRRLMRDSGLEKNREGQTRTLYSLRHTYATLELIENRTDLHTLAKQMGNSAAMIERHYSKLTATMAADRLA